MASNTERPLSAEEQKLIRVYCKPDIRDLSKAGKLVGMTPRRAKELYQRPAVKQEIDFRLGLLKQEQAKLDAEAEILPDSLIDKALARAVNLDPEKFGAAQLAAITLALVAKGRIETRNAKSVMAGTQQASAFRPQIYGSILPQAATPGTTTLRRTEEVIQTPPQQALPPAHVFEVIEH